MKAVILFSGGLDSTVLLAIAKEAKRDCYALSFDYGQRHRVELEAAKKIVKHYQIPHKIIKIDPDSFGSSALLSDAVVQKNRSEAQMAQQGIPNTYVPARNTLFLAYALGQAESLEASEIYVGFNAMDRIPYPDCRPEFVEAFQGLMRVATKQAVEGRYPKLVAPLINWDKAEIIKQGLLLGAPLDLSFSCYDPQQGMPCKGCDACVLREEGFRLQRA